MGQFVIYSDSESVFVAEAFFWIDTEDLSPPCWPRESADQRVLWSRLVLGVGKQQGLCQRVKKENDSGVYL